MSEFTTKIDTFIVDTDEKLLAVLKTALKEVVEETQTPRSAGGKMPVDTGFLRWSGTAALNAVPTGPMGQGRSRKKEDGDGPLPEYRSVDTNQNLDLNISRLQKGDTFYFGWIAKYAEFMEVKYGFLASAVQNWQRHVDNAVRMLRK